MTAILGGIKLCQSAGCEGAAFYLAHWPGQPCFMCYPCWSRACQVASVLGFELTCTPIEDIARAIDTYMAVQDAAERLAGTKPGKESS